MWRGSVGIRGGSVWAGWGVEIVDVEDVVRANCCNGLGGAGKCGGCAIAVGVSGMLGASVVTGEFWMRRLTCIADVKRYSMSPEKAALILSWMVV